MSIVHSTQSVLKKQVGTKDKAQKVTNVYDDVVLEFCLRILSAILLAEQHEKSKCNPPLRYDNNSLKYMWFTALLILVHRKGELFQSTEDHSGVHSRSMLKQDTSEAHRVPETQETACFSPYTPRRQILRPIITWDKPERPILLANKQTACGNCGAERLAMPVCARCRSQRYCSFRCLQQHQPVHESNCRRKL